MMRCALSEIERGQGNGKEKEKDSEHWLVTGRGSEEDCGTEAATKRKETGMRDRPVRMFGWPRPLGSVRRETTTTGTPFGITRA